MTDQLSAPLSALVLNRLGYGFVRPDRIETVWVLSRGFGLIFPICWNEEKRRSFLHTRIKKADGEHSIAHAPSATVSINS